MKALSRNCSHHSSIFVVQDYDEAIYKSSSLSNGIKNLENEVNGYNWYNGLRLEEINVSVRLKTDFYMKIRIEHIDAITPNIAVGYLKNTTYIELAIKHYVSIWGQLPGDLHTFPIHGDYSIEGNILFKGSSVFVIDWEHFSKQGGALGFDAMYLLFETLWLDGSNKKSILSHIIRMIKLLKNNNCLDLIFLNNPLAGTILFMQNNQHIWGDQFQKMPIVQYSKIDVAVIDDQINKGLAV